MTTTDDGREPTTPPFLSWATWVPCPSCREGERIPARNCLGCHGAGKVMALEAIALRARLGLT